MILFWSILGHIGLFLGGERPEEAKAMEEKATISESDGKVLLQMAREAIKARLFGEKYTISPGDIPTAIKEQKGVFVTITIGGQLRGCIGHILPSKALFEGVRENAINAAFRDPRFPPLTREEFSKIRLEVSVLTTPQRLEYKDVKDLLEKLRPNVDGVIIKKGFRQATFLPQVWEQLPSKEEFLGNLCLKAGLSPDAWERGDLEVQTYQVQAFHED